MYTESVCCSGLVLTSAKEILGTAGWELGGRAERFAYAGDPKSDQNLVFSFSTM
jgi:hypothetical protein